MSTKPTRIIRLKQVQPPENADISGQKRPKITQKQEEFLETLLLVHFISDAAEQMSISERTARRWLARPEIQEALEALRQERRDAIRNKIERSLDFATDLLERTLRDAAYPRDGHPYPGHERADKYVFALLKYAVDQREIDALKQRIAELETQPKLPHATAARRDAILQALTDEEIEMLERINQRLEVVEATIEQEER